MRRVGWSPRRARPVIDVCMHRGRWGCGVPPLFGRVYRHDGLVCCCGCLPWHHCPASRDEDGTNNDTHNDDERDVPGRAPLRRSILLQWGARAREMRERVAVVIVRGGSGTEPTVVMRQWQLMVVVAMASLLPQSMTTTQWWWWQLSLWSMVVAAMAVLTVAASTVDGGGGNGGCCQWGQWQLMVVAAMALFLPSFTTMTT